MNIRICDSRGEKGAQRDLELIKIVLAIRGVWIYEMRKRKARIDPCSGFAAEQICCSQSPVGDMPTCTTETVRMTVGVISRNGSPMVKLDDRKVYRKRVCIYFTRMNSRTFKRKKC